MILLNAWSRPLKSGMPNPKNYPWWPQVIESIICPIVQIAVKGDQALVADCIWDAPLSHLDRLLDECDGWLGVDSFFQHWAWHRNKPGIVLWGPSNPNIFGHPENINLSLGPTVWRPNQFLSWDQSSADPNDFVPPEQVLQALEKQLPGSTSKSLLNIM